LKIYKQKRSLKQTYNFTSAFAFAFTSEIKRKLFFAPETYTFYTPLCTFLLHTNHKPKNM